MAKKKPAPAPTKPAGRPAGKPNHPLAQADAVPSRCPKCGSTERGPYISKTEQDVTGVDPAYTHVIWRRTKCLACGQHRSDRSYENRTAQARK